MNLEEIIQQITHPEDVTDQFDADDIQVNQTAGVLSVFLFFIPILIAKESPYGKFCANQGLILLSLEIVVNIIKPICGKILSFVPLLGGLLVWALNLILLVIVVGAFLLLLISACQGRARKLPLIGDIFEAFS